MSKDCQPLVRKERNIDQGIHSPMDAQLALMVTQVITKLFTNAGMAGIIIKIKMEMNSFKEVAKNLLIASSPHNASAVFEWNNLIINYSTNKS